MPESSNSGGSGGIGFFGLLAIVFITLKLTGHIDWGWWLVLFPLWGPTACILLIVLLIAALRDDRPRRRF